MKPHIGSEVNLLSSEYLPWGDMNKFSSSNMNYSIYTSYHSYHNVFYAVIHLQLHAWWRIDVELWQGIMTKKQSDLNYAWTWTIHINLPFSRSRKPQDAEIVGAEIELINSVLVRNKSCLRPECCNWQTVLRTRPSRWKEMLKLELKLMFGWIGIGRSMLIKLACSTVLVCFNYFTSFRKDDF